MNTALLFRVGALMALGFAPFAWAGYKDDVGYTQLATELGGSLPTGSNVSIRQVEARFGGDGTVGSPLLYRPDTADADFSGVTFTFSPSGTNVGSVYYSTAPSAHATAVGKLIYGDAGSLTPGITTVTSAQAEYWLGSGFLRTGTGFNPLPESADVANFSWVGSTYDPDTGISYDTEVLARLDYSINVSDYVAVVGLNNGHNILPHLLGNSYNAIVAGVSSGNHSNAENTDVGYGPGRSGPDIVAPLSTTSEATGLVSSAAALLVSKGETISANATDSKVIKSLLMAGATKSDLTAWDYNTYGAGELNIANSYHILVAGEQTASDVTPVNETGWDLNSTTGSNIDYLFTVDQDSEFSAVLTWNAVINTSDWSSSLANLTLELYAADSGFEIGILVLSDLSTIDNVRLLYSDDLDSGNYILRLTGASGTEYAVAWETLAVPEPGTWRMLGLGAGMWVVFYRRRRNLIPAV